VHNNILLFICIYIHIPYGRGRNDVVYPVFRYRRRKHQGCARSELIKITEFSRPIRHNIHYYHLSHCRLKYKNGQIPN